MIPRRLLVAVVILLVCSATLAGYVLYLKRAAEQPPAFRMDAHPVPPPAAGPNVSVTLFVANDAGSYLEKQTATIADSKEPAKRAQEMLRALIAQYMAPGSPHPLGAGSDVNDVYLINNLAVVDVNAPFAEGHRSGILVEELTLASMAETLAANTPGITEMELLVDGKERDTLAGHADLTEPYEVAAAARLLKP